MADRGRRAFPISSAIIQEADHANAYKIHRDRVAKMRPAVDTCAPEDYSHFHYNAKRAMKQAERLFEIERENRILLEKMERNSTYTTAKSFRPWTCRSSLNYKQGMVYHHGTNGLQIDHMNMPVNSGTTSGSRHSTYKQRQAVEHLAKENLKIAKAIESRKPVYSAQTMEHEYLENVSRIERLSTFRGPKHAQHQPTLVARSLEAAKSMRSSKWLPGTAGYQKDLAKSMSRSMSVRQRRVETSDDVLSEEGSRTRLFGEESYKSFKRAEGAHRPRSLQSAPSVRERPRGSIFDVEAKQSFKRAATLTRSSTMAKKGLTFNDNP